MKKDPKDSYVTEHQLAKILDHRFDAFEERIERKIDQKFQKFSDDILEVIRDFSDRVDERFNRLEAKVDHLETRMDTLETKVDRLETKVDAIGVANQARDAQLARHERWHFRTASKLNINLNPEV